MLIDIWHFSFHGSDIEHSIEMHQNSHALEMWRLQELTNANLTQSTEDPVANQDAAQFKPMAEETQPAGNIQEPSERMVPKISKIHATLPNPRSANLTTQSAGIQT